jgi:hypothetical protein
VRSLDFSATLCPSIPELAWISLDQLFFLLLIVANSQERLQVQILKLSLEQKSALQDWLAEAIVQEQQQGESADIPIQSGREVVESRTSGKVTYRLEMVKCGKLACRCASGQLHGPYWYAYQKQTGRLKSRYVGKELLEPTEE